MSYIKETEVYKATQAFMRKEKEEVRKLKGDIIENADFACSKDEFEAVNNFLKFIDDIHILSEIAEYYDDIAQEKNADVMGF